MKLRISFFTQLVLVFSLVISAKAGSFNLGNLVVLQTNGTVSKASSSIYLKEINTNGSVTNIDTLPASGNNAIQTAGVFGGSEGFLTTATDSSYIVLAGFNTSTTFADITSTTASAVPRVVGKVSPSGNYIPVYSSTTAFNLNDIRGGVSDGTNFWASGASVANVDGVNYMGPSAPVSLATGAIPAKAYALHIFNGKIYYSTQKAGPSNTNTQLGIFCLGNNLPTTNANVNLSQVINTGTLLPQDFSFNPSGDVCYVCIGANTASGGIQKWTKANGSWSLAYTIGTGVVNVGAYGLVVDYNGSNPVLYATTFESTGNRIIKITDSGAGAAATTLVSAVSGVFYKGITFSPKDLVIPSVTLSLSASTASEAGNSIVQIIANSSSPVTNDQIVSFSVTGSGINSSDYTLSDSVIRIPAGSTVGSVNMTILNDGILEGNETASITLNGFTSGIVPGSILTASLIIVDNNTNTPPSVLMNVVATNNLIDGGVLLSPTSPFTISGTLNDSLDPMGKYGIVFNVNDQESAFNSLIISITSSDSTVVPLNKITLVKANGLATLRIRPVKLGYSTIVLNVSDSITVTSYQINFASSDGSPEVIPSKTFWHTGMSDGSTGIPLDSLYYVAGDDELNVLNVYHRSKSGLPVKSYSYTSFLNLPNPSSPEVDVEASAASPVSNGKYYWTGSMSNGKFPYDNKPNRDRLFSTFVTKTADSTSFAFSGYVNIRTALLAWGDTNGYNFTSSAAAGSNSKALAGFSIEGMAFGPDNTTLYLGLRAPLVPTSFRHNAVIAPLLNFETWFNNGNPNGPPAFGSPIELDLDFRGIREIIRLSNGTYIIVAGSPVDDGGVNNIYKWSGLASDLPVSIPNSVGSVLNIEGVMEVKESNGQMSYNKLQVICDGGSVNLYGDNNEAKNFNILNLRKYRSDLVEGLSLAFCPSNQVQILSNRTTMCVGDSILIYAPLAPNSTFLWNNGSTNQFTYAKTYQTYTLQTTDINNGCTLNSNPITISKSMPTDFDNNNITDNFDFLLLLGMFNQACSCEQDLNRDGIVNNNDFLILLGAFNQICKNN